MQLNIKSKNDRRSAYVGRNCSNSVARWVTSVIEAVKRSTPRFGENLELLNHEINARD